MHLYQMYLSQEIRRKKLLVTSVTTTCANYIYSSTIVKGCPHNKQFRCCTSHCPTFHFLLRSGCWQHYRLWMSSVHFLHYHLKQQYLSLWGYCVESFLLLWKIQLRLLCVTWSSSISMAFSGHVAPNHFLCLNSFWSSVYHYTLDRSFKLKYK